MIRQLSVCFYISWALVSLMLLSSCRGGTSTNDQVLSATQKVSFLDKGQAAEVIGIDNTDHYFDKVMELDMSLQMKKVYPEGTLRQTILLDYVQSLKGDVLDFSPSEQTLLKDIFKEIYSLYGGISTSLFPVQVNLIKTHGSHFGPGVYYTREHSIVIPEDVLVNPDRTGLLKVMLHELSHIFTRTHPLVKRDLYALLGFKKLEQTNLLINDSLYRRILLNPDGMDYTWVTSLPTSDGHNTLAMPLICSNAYAYSSTKPSYMQYLYWNYFEVKHTAQGFDVLTNAQLKSTLDASGLPALFKSKFNTDYIIHPDEIVADNFALLLYGKRHVEGRVGVTDVGRESLGRIEGILRGVK